MINVNVVVIHVMAFDHQILPRNHLLPLIPQIPTNFSLSPSLSLSLNHLLIFHINLFHFLLYRLLHLLPCNHLLA